MGIENIQMQAKLLSAVLVGCTLMVTGCTSKTVVQPAVKVVVDQNKVLIDELKEGLALYFDNNSAEVDVKYHIYLAAAAQFLKKDSNFVLNLQGHTDSSGSSATNKRISRERANAVRNQMIRNYGVNPEQIVASGVGSTQPVASNATAEGRAQNRRVTATLGFR
mgnify:CR=1 FL=1